MNLEQYIGLPYCIHNTNGHNCWAFVGLVYMDLFGIRLQDYDAGKGTNAEIAACFINAFATGDHGFKKVEKPMNFDVVVFNSGKHFHCGLWYQGKVMHCSQYTGGSVLQTLDVARRGFKRIDFWRR